MSKTRDDFYLLQQMLNILDYFKIKETFLSDLVFDLNNLEGQLKSIEDSWKEAVKMTWLGLEAISGSIDSETSDQNSYSAEEKKAILDTVEELKREISKKRDSFRLRYCNACGYDTSDSKLWTNPLLSKDTCDCCGLEFGRDENSLEKIRAHRDAWIQHPTLWHNPQAKPENWKLEDQMEHIPSQYL